MIQIAGAPTAADRIPRDINQLSTGVILSNKNKKGRIKSVMEHSDSRTPCFFTSSGDNISQPNGTDRIGYNDHVIRLLIAKSTITQAKIETTHVIEKDKSTILRNLAIPYLLKNNS